MWFFVNESLACEESLVVWSGVKMGSLWKKRVPRRGSVDYISRGGETLSFLGRVSELWATETGTAGQLVGQKASGSTGRISGYSESEEPEQAGVVGMCSSSSQMEQGRVACHWRQGTAGKG